MEALRSYVTFVDTCQNVRRYNPEISNLQFVGSEFLKAVSMKSLIFWNIKPYSLLKVSRRFGEYIAMQKDSMKRAASEATCYLLHDGFLLGLFFDPEDGGHIFLRNIGRFSTDNTSFYPRI
jgi:hypothetical protein